MTTRRDKIGNVFCHIYLIILAVVAFFPLVWVLLCSVKTSGDLTANPTRILPKQFTLENFLHVINELGFAENIANSLLIAISTTCIAIRNCKVFPEAWFNYVQSACDHLYVSADSACNSIFHGNGKGRTGKYENRTGDCLSVFQRTVCGMDAGGLL